MAPSPTSLGRAALISLLLSSLIPSSSAIPSPDMSYKQAAFGVLDTSPKPDGGHLHSTAAKRVNVTLGVMSRCPDALACEAAFDKVLERVNTKTHLSMTYIGSLPKTKQSPRYGVECMHGDQECLGNIQQLCVQDALNPRRASEDFDLSPSAAQKKWWSFIQCQNYAGIPSIGSEDLAKRCLKLIDGPDWDKDGISDCINGKKGRKLLKDSVANTHSLNITKSCTVLIESGDHCVRDGGVWKECNIGHEVGDFVSAIERAWEKKNNNSTHSSETFSSRAVSPSSHGMPSLVKRQQAPPPTGSDQSNNNGPFGGQSRTPPSVFVSKA